MLPVAAIRLAWPYPFRNSDLRSDTPHATQQLTPTLQVSALEFHIRRALHASADSEYTQGYGWVRAAPYPTDLAIDVNPQGRPAGLRHSTSRHPAQLLPHATPANDVARIVTMDARNVTGHEVVRLFDAEASEDRQLYQREAEGKNDRCADDGRHDARRNRRHCNPANRQHGCDRNIRDG